MLNKVKEIVKPQYLSKVNWPHGWPHVLGVERTAVDLAKLENQDPIICGIAAYCHDLGRIVEEENGQIERGLKKEERKYNHAELSIEPTEEILNGIGIKGNIHDEILEAIKVHSDLKYSGSSRIAKILRDADKSEGFGEWGLLRGVNFVLKYDFQPPQREDVLEISRKALNLIDKIQKNPKDKERYLECLEFNLEWYDMLDTESAKILLKSDYKYTKSVQKYMLNEI